MGVVNPAVAGPRTRGNKARPWSSPGARAAGPQPRRQARFPGDAGQRPALPGLASGLWQAGSVAGTRTRGNTARRWSAPGPRAAGPQPRRQARFPGEAGQRPALPGLASGLWQAGSVAGTRTRGNTARRWSAPGARAAPAAAARRASPGKRASGPRSQGWQAASGRPDRSPGRVRVGTRRGGGPRRDRGPLARSRAARRASPGKRASGPRSRGWQAASGRPDRSPGRARVGTRRGGGPRRDRGPLARSRAARRASPGKRASGPRSQ